MTVSDSNRASEVRAQAVDAERRIRPHVRETPLEPSPWLARRSTCQVYLKLENLQVTGSFKVRGAANRLLMLTSEERARGVITASTGNHGAAVAHLLGVLGCPGTVVVPRGAAGLKVDRLRALGADIQIHGDDCVEAEVHAREVADRTGAVYISPYNDRHVVAGQATIGLEIERQLEKADVVLVPVGGGGLIAGIAGCLKAVHPKVEIIGCQPERSAVMRESVRAGRIVELALQPTLSDGTAGGIEPGAITFDLCRHLVDDFLLVGEDLIRDAIRLVVERQHVLVEGAAALPVAALLAAEDRFRGRSVVLVLSGAVIAPDTLRDVLG